MSRFWSPGIAELTPYVPGEQPQRQRLVKLNTNENPYGPSPKVLEAIAAATGDGLRLYPEPTSIELRRTIAEYYGVTAEQVFVGNGSDEVLAFVFRALLKHDRPLLFPDISYSFYPVYCGLYDIEHRTVPLDEQFGIRVDDYLTNANRANGGIIFPNPNAPTSRALPLADIERLLQANTDSVVVIDEAYVDFGADTAIALVDRYPNLLVIQTLSKSRSLAGVRVGLAVGHPDLINGLVRVKDSFNSYPLDRLAQAAAKAAFEDEAWFQKTRNAIVASRDALDAAMVERGFEVLPSAANFVFARHPDWAGADLAQALRDRDIIVRHFAKPRIADYLRITIGTEEQNQALVAALDEILAP